VNTTALFYLGAALVGYFIRHKFPPASSSPAAPVSPPAIVAPAVPGIANPFAQNHPALTALLSQGEQVVQSALQDWLANGLPGAAPAASATHPLLTAADQIRQILQAVSTMQAPAAPVVTPVVVPKPA
jgi:hypothetical protein